jgi:hypothetical protein
MRLPIDVTLAGIDSLGRLEQLANAESDMVVRFFPSVMFVRTRQSANALSPIVVTVSGTVKLVNGIRAKAPGPILVTGKPFIEAGIVTTPPSPL